MRRNQFGDDVKTNGKGGEASQRGKVGGRCGRRAMSAGDVPMSSTASPSERSRKHAHCPLLSALAVSNFASKNGQPDGVANAKEVLDIW